VLEERAHHPDVRKLRIDGGHQFSR